MKRSKKKLPKFYLGTRKPTSLGYQPNYGIGTGQFTSVKGEDITPETRAMQQNIVPGALSKLTQHSSPALQMLQNSVGSAASAIGSSVARSAAKRAGKAVAQFLPDVLPGSASGANAASSAGNAAGSASSGAASGAVGAAGTALGILGSAYGLTDIGFQIANAGSHRTAADMRNTLTTNTYTTAGGNQYTEKGGVDIGAELAYERANTAAKQTNLIASSAGTGASIGGVIGTVVPGIGNIIGTVGGGLIGGAIGGIASLLGFGDNEEDMLAEAKLTNDVSSMGNRQNRSEKESLDVYNSFYGKGSDGTVGAAYGKRPVYSAFGPISKKATARVSNGELIGNFEDGYVSRVPGTPNNKDTKLAALRPSDFVISNKFGLSDYAATTGDIEGALNMQDILMKQYKNKYKNGKLPGFKLGLGDYALATLPHFGQFLDSIQQYNTDRNAQVVVPDINADYSGAKQIASQMIGDQESVRPYLDQSFRDYKQALWNMQRNPGLGLGGRLLGSTSLFKSKLAQDAKTRLAVEEANRAQRNTGRQILANVNSHEVDVNNQNAWNRHQAWQQANAARDLAMRTDRKNMLDAIGGGFADVFKTTQYDRAQDYKERLMKLYENQQWLDLQQFLKDNGGETNTTTKKSPAGYISLLPSWQRGFAMQNLLSAPKYEPLDVNSFKFDRNKYDRFAPVMSRNLPNGLFNPSAYKINTWR